MHIFPRLFPTNTIIETVSGIVDGLKTVSEQTKLMFPLVLKLIKLLLVVPATSATAERSFSTMKRLKTYLRSSMGQARLNHLCLLTVYSELVSQLNIVALVDEFSCANAYRAQIFGI